MSESVYETPEYIRSQRESTEGDRSEGERVARAYAEDYQHLLPRQGWVLNLGCQTGVEQLVWREHGIWNVVGLDLFGQKALENGVPIVQGDMHRLPFGDKAFWFVYSRDTLEHSPDPESVLSEVFRVLQPGGRAFFCVPVNHHAPYHYTVLSKEGWRALFGRRFQILEEFHHGEHEYCAYLG